MKETELICECDDVELQMYLHSYRTENDVEFRLGCTEHNIVLKPEEKFCPQCFDEGKIKAGEMTISPMRLIPAMEQIFEILGDKFYRLQQDKHYQPKDVWDCMLLKDSIKTALHSNQEFVSYYGQSAQISLIKALKGVINEQD